MPCLCGSDFDMSKVSVRLEIPRKSSLNSIRAVVIITNSGHDFGLDSVSPSQLLIYFVSGAYEVRCSYEPIREPDKGRNRERGCAHRIISVNSFSFNSFLCSHSMIRSLELSVSEIFLPESPLTRSKRKLASRGWAIKIFRAICKNLFLTIMFGLIVKIRVLRWQTSSMAPRTKRIISFEN